MSDTTLNVIILTLQTAIVSTLLTLPFSIMLGWLLARDKMPFKTLVEAIISIPLVTPPIVTGFLLLKLFGKSGLVGRILHSFFSIDLTFNFAALIIASAAVSLPLSVRAIRSAFEMVNPNLEDAARTLGANPIQTFFRVTLPLSYPGILSGAVLAFARSLGEFGATITIAGNIPDKTQTIALKIYSYLQSPEDDSNITALILISIFISFGAMVAANKISTRKAY